MAHMGFSEIKATRCPDCSKRIGYPIGEKHADECPRIAYPKTDRELRDDIVKAVMDLDGTGTLRDTWWLSELEDAVRAYKAAVKKSEEEWDGW